MKLNEVTRRVITRTYTRTDREIWRGEGEGAAVVPRGDLESIRRAGNANFLPPFPRLSRALSSFRIKCLSLTFAQIFQ